MRKPIVEGNNYYTPCRNRVLGGIQIPSYRRSYAEIEFWGAYEYLLKDDSRHVKADVHTTVIYCMHTNTSYTTSFAYHMPRELFMAIIDIECTLEYVIYAAVPTSLLHSFTVCVQLIVDYIYHFSMYYTV